MSCECAVICDKSECQIKVPIVWVLGGPCSGKGTQCEKIAKEYGFVHLSTGDLLRDEVARGTPTGKHLDEIMKRGDLVPNADILSLLKAAVCREVSRAPGFLIDGYPREKDQGVEFEKCIGPVTLILYFEVSDGTMMERMHERAKTSTRSDDNEETMKKRLDTFRSQKDLILQQYSGKVKTIDAGRGVDEIFADVQRYLNEAKTL